MTYRRRTKGSQKFQRMGRASVAARRQKMLESPRPSYAPDLPDLRRELIVIDHDFGEVRHHFELRKSTRIDSYQVTVDGQQLPGRYGWSRVLEMARKSFIRVGVFD
jgi:hypothetical protein